MKIFQLSDLHLEFGPLDAKLPTGEVVILGGDITLLGALDPESPYYHDGRGVRERTMAFVEQCKTNFERVFYLIGNHESYNYSLTLAPGIIRRKLPMVTLLDDTAVDLGSGVILAGGTLWTDMNEGKAAWAVGRGMNDFRCISIEDKSGDNRIFTPQDAMERFARTKRFLARTAKKHPDETIVVATHHAPDKRGINKEHVDDRYGINHGYFTDMTAFIAEHPNIKWWSHGHTHIQTAYKIGQCQVISNARGYINREHSADTFSPDCWFDPVTGKMRKPGRSSSVRARVLAE